MGDEYYYDENQNNISYQCPNWAPVLSFTGISMAVAFASKSCDETCPVCHCSLNSFRILELLDFCVRELQIHPVILFWRVSFLTAFEVEMSLPLPKVCWSSFF